MTYPGGTTAGMPLPLRVGETMTMGIRLTVPVTVSPGVVNTTTFTVTLIYEGESYMSVAVEDIAVVRQPEPQFTYIYLPLVLRAYTALTNGNFSAGLTGGTSGILGVSIPSIRATQITPWPCSAIHMRGWRSLLGDTKSIRQSFFVPRQPVSRCIPFFVIASYE